MMDERTGQAAGPWVELRVHGVRATAPEDMLDVDRVRQVAGDELGRVFRRAGRRGELLPEPDGHVVEAYHWGKLTSGSFSQALWLLLAPFGLVNAALFTLPRITGPGPEQPALRWHALARAALRLVGLAMTVLFVLTATVLTVDLWAWQSRTTDGVPYALALLGPVALLGGFWWAAGPRPPAIRAASTQPDPEPPGRRTDGALVDPGFFRGVTDLATLRYLHVAAGLAVVAGAGASVTAVPGLAPVLRGVAAVLIVAVALAVTLGRRIGLTGPRGIPVAQAVAALAAGAVVVTVGGALAAPAGGAAGGLPGVDLAACLVMLVAVVGIVLLAIANLGLIRSAGPPDSGAFAPYAGGWGATLLALLGLFLGVGYSGAFATVVAAALTTPERVVPELLSRVAYAWGITALGVLALVGYLLVRRRAAVAALLVAVEADFGDRLTGRWTRKVAAARWAARLKNGIACVLGVFGLLGVVLTVFAAIDLLPVFGGPKAALPYVLDVLSWWPRPGEDRPAGQMAVLTLGTLTLTALATGLVLLARTALFGASARRGVNVVWDVVAFWPRAVHPFVPSAYSARAVADIEDRVRWHLRSAGARRIAVCGHSQGSLLTFAALVRLAASDRDRDLLPRIAYLTFGSQLQVMFARGFPGFVNRAVITTLYADLGGAWRNLYRDTDPLAGPVLSWNRRAPKWIDPDLPRRPGPGWEEYGPDWRLLDPEPPADPTLQLGCLLPLRGHGEFWLDDAWYAALATIGCGARSDARPG